MLYGLGSRRHVKFTAADHPATMLVSANIGNIRAWIALLFGLLFASPALAQPILLRPARVFDGVNPAPHEGWSVLVDGDRISAVGPNLAAPAGARVIDLPGTTLTPDLGGTATTTQVGDAITAALGRG